MVQWELEKIDERILDVLKLDKVKELIKNKKIALNLPCDKNAGDLLYKIYTEVYLICIEKTKDLLRENNLLEDFLKLDDNIKLEKLNEFLYEGTIKLSENLGIFVIRPEGEDGGIVIANFLEKIGFELNINDIITIAKHGGGLKLLDIESGLYIKIHKPGKLKIDKNGNNIWRDGDKKGEEFCDLLNREFEWSISGNKEGTVIPHQNPCINKISFGNLESSSKDIEKSYLEHSKKIANILIKYKYTDNFDKSELCNICLNGKIEQATNGDYYNFKIRRLKYNLKKIFSKILFK